MIASARIRRALLALTAVGLTTAAATPAADAVQTRHFKQAQGLQYKTCADPEAVADGFKCATVVVPKNYADGRDGTLRLAVTVRPAGDKTQKSLGPLFVNYGGPGGDAVATTQQNWDAEDGGFFSRALTDRFDLVAVDPRGTGESQPSIDCKANQLTQGIYSFPYLTPRNIDVGAFQAKVRGYVNQCVRLNRGVLPYVSTANVARDFDYVRTLLGARKLSYFGFSYGTFLGATYASLFPQNYRAAVLDGALDAKDYINRPHEDLTEQTAGFERALSRYFQASLKGDPTYSTWIENGDAEGSYDDLIDRASAAPIPAPNTAAVRDGSQTSTQPVTGDEINNMAIGLLYSKFAWPYITQALNAAHDGDGSYVRFWSDRQSGKLPDGSFDPGTDRYFAIGAQEQRYTGPLQQYLDWGESSWKTFDHFYSNVGYTEYNYRVFPIDGVGVYSGPFRVPANAKTPLVVGTTYDPATVYRQAIRLVDDLGNARLLTMKGDGHTAYQEGSTQIDDTIDQYLLQGTLPAPGTAYKQDVAFPPAPAPTLRAQHQAPELPRPIITRRGAGF